MSARLSMRMWCAWRRSVIPEGKGLFSKDLKRSRSAVMLVLQSSSSELVSEIKSGSFVPHILEEQCKAYLQRCISSGTLARHLGHSVSTSVPSSPLSTRTFHSCREKRILSWASVSKTLACQFIVVVCSEGSESCTTGPRRVSSCLRSKSLRGPEDPPLFNTWAAPCE